MIDMSAESLVPLSKAAGWVPPTRGRRVHPSTLWRWAERGVRGVNLEVVRVGGTVMTSQDALTRFFRALTDGTQAEAPRRGQALERKHERAKARLAEAGI